MCHASIWACVYLAAIRYYQGMHAVIKRIKLQVGLSLYGEAWLFHGMWFCLILFSYFFPRTSPHSLTQMHVFALSYSINEKSFVLQTLLWANSHLRWHCVLKCNTKEYASTTVSHNLLTHVDGFGTSTLAVLAMAPPQDMGPSVGAAYQAASALNLG